jgi:hypothetical protein
VAPRARTLAVAAMTAHFTSSVIQMSFSVATSSL